MTMWSRYRALVVLALLCTLLILGARPASAETTFVVNSTADSGDNNTADNACFTGNIKLVLAGGVLLRESECTLRAAVEQANATAGTDTVNFSIRTEDSGYNSTTGVWTITPASALPEITGPVTINGYTQPGASANTNGPGQGDNAVLKIELDGSNSTTINPDGTTGPSAPILRISGGASKVKGLVINRPRVGSAAIFLTGPGDNIIEGNFVGSNPSGTAGLGCQPAVGAICRGLIVNTSTGGNVIGGTTPAARNVFLSGIFGTDERGRTTWSGFVDAVAIESDANVVRGNLIGTDAAGTGTAGVSGEGNGMGIRISGGAGNTIGGTTPAARNVISNNYRGVDIADGSGSGITDIGAPHDNSVQGNFIGTDVTGTGSLYNLDGVFIAGASSNKIGGTEAGAGNVISSNIAHGVFISSGGGNSVLSNSISGNGKLGIDLDSPRELEDNTEVTPNDLLDTDSGANNLQNFPVLTSALVSGSTVTVTGKLNSAANKAYNVQFFSNTSADPSGNGEGRTYLGQRTNVTTDGSGDAGFTFTALNAPTGKQVVTATATSQSGDTSEFSAAVSVKPANDDFAEAPAMNGDTQAVNGITAEATREPGEPDHLPADDTSMGERSVWYRWTAPASARVTTDTCTTNIGTVLAVYTGDSFGNLSRVTDNDDGCESGTGSRVTFQAKTGATYRIAVSGHDNNSEGTFTLDFSPLVTGVTTPRTRRANITVRFSEPMAPDSLMRNAKDPIALFSTSQTIVLLQGTSSSATEVPAKVRCTDASCKTVTLNPDALLGKRKTYTVEVRGALDVQESGIGVAVQDLRGNRLVQDYFRAFRTGYR